MDFGINCMGISISNTLISFKSSNDCRYSETKIHESILMLTIGGYVVHWEVMDMSHVTNGREDHKASQDTCERIGNGYN